MTIFGYTFTVGELMFYGGATGAVISLIIVIAALKIFSSRRRKMLKKIMESL